jgi:hypothetical protein
MHACGSHWSAAYAACQAFVGGYIHAFDDPCEATRHVCLVDMGRVEKGDKVHAECFSWSAAQVTDTRVWSSVFFFLNSYYTVCACSNCAHKGHPASAQHHQAQQGSDVCPAVVSQDAAGACAARRGARRRRHQRSHHHSDPPPKSH